MKKELIERVAKAIFSDTKPPWVGKWESLSPKGDRRSKCTHLAEVAIRALRSVERKSSKPEKRSRDTERLDFIARGGKVWKLHNKGWSARKPGGLVFGDTVYGIDCRVAIDAAMKNEAAESKRAGKAGGKR